MTEPEQVPPVPPAAAPQPSAPAPAVPPTLRYRYGDVRYGMSLVAMVLGTYLLSGSPITQVAQVVLSRQTELVPIIVGPVVVAALVVVFAVLVAPTTPARRIVSLVIVLVAVLVVDIAVPAYYTGALRAPAVAVFLLGPAFLSTLAASAAWLTLRERNPVSYLFLIATLVIPFALFGLVSAGLAAGVTTPVQNVLVTVVGVGIAWLGYAVSRSIPPPHPVPSA